MKWQGITGSLLAVLAAGLARQGVTGELIVGPGRMYARIEEALAGARPGDVITVMPRTGNAPYEKVALPVNLPGITLRAAGTGGQRIILSGAGYDYSGRGAVPRAIIQFNRGADGGTVVGFELRDAHNATHNGAGVRINQANNVAIRDCTIEANDMGIMSNGDGTPATAANQRIENCLICRNGNRGEPGMNHNLYLGGTSVTVTNCDIHSSLTGHNLKSRTHRIVVSGCSIHDSANRELDLVDGGTDTAVPGSDALLEGNRIVKAKSCPGNRGVIHFGQDVGGTRNGTLRLVRNTVVTPYMTPVIMCSVPGVSVVLLSNVVCGVRSGHGGQTLLSATGKRGSLSGADNWLSASFRDAYRSNTTLDRTVFGAPDEEQPARTSQPPGAVER